MRTKTFMTMASVFAIAIIFTPPTGAATSTHVTKRGAGQAATGPRRPVATDDKEFNPFAPDAEQKLREYDRNNEEHTGLPSFLPDAGPFGMFFGRGCYRESCHVFARVSKETQMLYLTIDGYLSDTWPVSTGVPGLDTPNLDTHPDGRIYWAYTSKRFPEGDYEGLGNMPYAVFIRSGVAIHGTPRGNWRRLGTRASHGCIRLRPDHALTFNLLVRRTGTRGTWVTVD